MKILVELQKKNSPTCDIRTPPILYFRHDMQYDIYICTYIQYSTWKNWLQRTLRLQKKKKIELFRNN